MNYKQEELKTLKQVRNNLHNLELEPRKLEVLYFNFNKRIKELE